MTGFVRTMEILRCRVARVSETLVSEIGVGLTGGERVRQLPFTGPARTLHGIDYTAVVRSVKTQRRVPWMLSDSMP